MSKENVEAVKRWFEALQRGDPAPGDVRSGDRDSQLGGVADPRPYLGRKGVHPMVGVQRLVGNFRMTGIEVRGAWGAIVSVRRGKILSAIGYATPRRARRAGGLD